MTTNEEHDREVLTAMDAQLRIGKTPFTQFQLSHALSIARRQGRAEMTPTIDIQLPDGAVRPARLTTIESADDGRGVQFTFELIDQPGEQWVSAPYEIIAPTETAGLTLRQLACCDLHGPICESPSELCCAGCDKAGQRPADA